jgi:hypothetical protein
MPTPQPRLIKDNAASLPDTSSYTRGAMPRARNQRSTLWRATPDSGRIIGTAAQSIESRSTMRLTSHSVRGAVNSSGV